MRYKALVNCYSGKVKAGDYMPDNWEIDQSWIDGGIVEMVKTTSKVDKIKKAKIEEVDDVNES